ncbi:MAG: hypothetical protein CMK43_07110 [Porticoccaceae bacterium]|nr:hypothetical protein [Porticoccaceae bacterium]
MHKSVRRTFSYLDAGRFFGLGILLQFADPLTEYSKNDAGDAVANASGVISVAGIISLVNQNKGVVVDH